MFSLPPRSRCSVHQRSSIVFTGSRRAALWAGLGVLAFAAGGCRERPREHTSAPVASGSAVPSEAAASCDKSGGVFAKDVLFKRACSPYLLSSGIQVVNGATLTIEPGVELQFPKGASLEVGVAGKPGRLVAEGSDELPIVLSAATASEAAVPGAAAPARATWGGVRFGPGTLPGSVLARLGVSAAGAPDSAEAGCVTATEVKHGALRLAYVNLDTCQNSGLFMRDSAVQLGPMKIANSPAGIVSDAPSVAALPVGIQYEAVPLNVITGGKISQNTVWAPQGRPYLIRGDIEVGGTPPPALILQAGVELRFKANTALSVGAEAPGILKAMGSKESPVRIRGEAEPGAEGSAWRGLRFGKAAGPGSSLEYVELSGAGADGGVRIETSPKSVVIRDSSFSSNALDVSAGCQSQPELTRVQFSSKRGLVREPCH